MKSYIKALRHYADFNGRARRKEYWMFALFNIIFVFVWAILMMLAFALVAGASHSFYDPAIAANVAYYSYIILALLPGLALSVRRLHDTGRSGWMMLIGLIPCIGGIWLFVLMLLRGTQGDNKYGPDSITSPEIFDNRAKLKSAAVALIVASFVALILAVAYGWISPLLQFGAGWFWSMPFTALICFRIFPLASIVLLIIAGFRLSRAKTVLGTEAQGAGRQSIALLLVAVALPLVAFVWNLAVMTKGSVLTASSTVLMINNLANLVMALLACSLLFAPQDKALVGKAAVTAIIVTSLCLAWNVYFKMLINAQGNFPGAHQTQNLLGVFNMLTPAAFVILSGTFFSLTRNPAAVPVMIPQPPPLPPVGQPDFPQPGKLDAAPPVTHLNNNIMTIKDMKCPVCGADEFIAIGSKGAGWRMIIGAFIGWFLFRQFFAKKITANWPVYYKCKKCKHKFLGEPVEAPREEILSAPCVIQFERTWNLVGAALLQIVHLNGLKIGTVKNGKTITFQTHVRKNVIFVTDQYGVAFSDQLTFEAQPGASMSVRFNRKFK